MKPSHFIERLRRNPFIERKTLTFSGAEDFSDLYENTYPAIYRYIFGLTGGPANEAEDICAETFLKAWKNRHQYHGEPQNAIGWLIRIARNLVVDTYRYEKSRPNLHAGELDDDLYVRGTPTPEEDWMKSEDQRTLLRLLQTLPPKEREIVVLRYLLGWKVNEIARHFEMPENTVSVIIRRSLERLQQNWPVEQE